jgi:hypothetical protein
MLMIAYEVNRPYQQIERPWPSSDPHELPSSIHARTAPTRYAADILNGVIAPLGEVRLRTGLPNF